MKKMLAIVLVIAMIASLAVIFTACGKTQTEAAKKPADSVKIKVGLICLHDDSSTYDANFINGLAEAVGALADEYIEVETIVKTGIGENNNCYLAAKELVAAGCKVVFADSFGHEDYMIKAAKEYPNVQFCHATGVKAHTENLANYANAFASIYEGRYLAGVAAGLKLKAMKEADSKVASKIGYVGAFPYAEVVSGYTSFFLGVRSIVSDVTMEVQYTSSWYDPTTEKQAALNLINRGAVLISQHADSMGAPTACQEKGVPNVTYNISTRSDTPETYVAGSRINWAPYYSYVISSVVLGQAVATDYCGTIATGSVQTLELGDACVPGTAKKLIEVKNALASGALVVFDTSKFTVGGEAVETYLADVDDDGTFTGETEVIANGKFNESLYRSAPYFDLRIDGITELK
ncbi:MAG: BMP family ABC transporter substrate-binding protein [Clostridia bacterium]|nr:BMP family ABC transporter substrate-binding protein [Clostridia bacterium]